jgi:uncharacterized membrane protein YuzA (DUF378 family)
MEDMKHCTWCKLACFLVIIGALNWGLVGLGGLIQSTADWNVVHILLGSWPVVEYIVYLLVGLAGIFKMFSHRCPCHKK